MASFPPYSDESLQYYLWGLRKGFLRPERDVPEIEIPEEQTDAYNLGIRDGENYGANGYPVDQVCYDLKVEHNPAGQVAEAVDLLIEAGGAIHTAKTVGILVGGIEAG